MMSKRLYDPLPHYGRGKGPIAQRWEGEGVGSCKTLTRRCAARAATLPAMRERG
jgi:hypothetical protein